MKQKKNLEEFEKWLYQEERAELTIQKYLRDVRRFLIFSGKREITKELVLAYKNSLKEVYQISSVNSMLAAVNRFLDFTGRKECKVRQLRVQKAFFYRKEEILTQAEYERLVRTAEKRGDIQLSLIMQTLCSMGIRISELDFVTVQGVRTGYIYVTNKGKTRLLVIPGLLSRLLLAFCRQKNIRSGPVFLSENGKPVDRSVVWRKMKKLCAAAGIDPGKVFPHNLRHLFAITFYRQKKDLLCLAEILGHASMETTRIYARTAGAEYGKMLAGLGLVCAEEKEEKKSHNYDYVTGMGKVSKTASDDRGRMSLPILLIS